MAKPRKANSVREFEDSLNMSDSRNYVLRLYVAGMTPRSTMAIANIRRICEENLKGRYQLEVFDVYQQPKLAKEAEIVVAPTLIKKLPLPLRTLVGDMSNEKNVLLGLDLRLKDGRTSKRRQTK